MNRRKFRSNKSAAAPGKGNNSLGPGEETSEFRLRQIIENDLIDSKYGFEKVKDRGERTGFLLNMHQNEMLDEDKRIISSVDFYFVEEDGARFKVSYPFMPYFYIRTKPDLIQEVTQFLSKKFTGLINQIDVVLKDDLDMPNHLVGLKQTYIKLSFYNQTDLMKVRKEILQNVRKNRIKQDDNAFYNEMLTNTLVNKVFDVQTSSTSNHMENILDIREYDVPFHTRVSIDLKIFCGSWYTVKFGPHQPPTITPRPDLLERPEPIVLAFDIETTKLPLKFPDAKTDQIMMISYMIDGQGYLITNREILSQDIEDFEYTPKPEFEGKFEIFNEPNEMALLQKFFDHIMDVRPHIFVTYNGDFFDWPFIETRAAVYDLDMKQEIGFAQNREGVYCSRPATHMDCICWVKRDSYLPVGSHGLKAVAKAKLRYDPVELDPEEMCPLAASQPQVLSNYSVSDAVATYYLYMQYVHPFIFALCTIIPCEPDEVLRKGSGTLCEALLMVEAFHCNIIFPNKQESILNKLTDDGHVLHQETYVGGHVEALKSGVFRADIPYGFCLVPDTLDKLIEQVPRTLKHAIEIEEGVPLTQVENLEEVTREIISKLEVLKAQPKRLEKPLIYHLDVGAMYPNIILTNRLQPCASVNEDICASCDFNKPEAVCKRNMVWEWRGEFMPATKNEYHRIQQQLETEKFPPLFKDGPQRAFHQLSKQEQADIEKKRLSVYCRKVYKKEKITRVEKRTTTICQKENSFYVDTVRAFRDRRYDYKAFSKKAKQAVQAAIKGGDASEIKSAKNREVLYDSLQLAHKCILNSFYGYVMRKGSRWYSMEMAGIVCYTGANIITKTREIIEQIGQPLELDTDGIWCILPATFPENFTILTSNEKKKKIVISYPNAVLNEMVKEHFTNEQYHELVDPETLRYEVKNENSIFFEVDGPYKAMVLPASTEEGKRLKKRYAVFNFDGSLAELKGFEVKRRGELQLIKNFQSSVFEAFLKGDDLTTCYAAVAQVADYWLDVLYSHGKQLPDSELFGLISENRSMSKRLEEYGAQKSSSISTAKRLAEFLGDQMVKDAGLACKYVISKKPDGAPVTERAIPLAIFQTEEAVQKHYLRKWLKDSSISTVDIRNILDWQYYIERLSEAIRKIITIPAAMQDIPNPVPRVQPPKWLHKKILEKDDKFKQTRITDMFKPQTEPMQIGDVEDLGAVNRTETRISPKVAVVTKRKRNNKEEFSEEDLRKTWREVLGSPPPKTEQVAWIAFQKKKWAFQMLQRNLGENKRKKVKNSLAVLRSTAPGTLGGFLQRAQRSLLTNPWHVLQIAPTGMAGEFKLWALVQGELHQLKLTVPRIFYANLKSPKCADEGALFKKCNRTLPRSRPVYNLYMYSVPEDVYQEHGSKILLDLSDPDVEGVYETQVPLLFRALMQIGCVCRVRPGVRNLEHFDLEDLEMTTFQRKSYIPNDSLRHLFFYNHKHATKNQQIFALFLTPLRKALVIVHDTVRTNLMPNLGKLYKTERATKLEKDSGEILPPDDVSFEVRVETSLVQVYKSLQKYLQEYKDEKKGPTLLVIQSITDSNLLQSKMPIMCEFPQVEMHIKDSDDLYNVIEWQKKGATALIRHYLNSEKLLPLMIEQSAYLHLPLGNRPADPGIFGADLVYARYLTKHNHVLWCSPLDRPDLGGSEESDARLLAENLEESSEVCNSPGWYSKVCVELEIDCLPTNTLLMSNHVTDIEGTSASTAFDAVNAATVQDMVTGNNLRTIYDEGARCAEAFKILRTMASSWVRDISRFGQRCADFQVVHLYRWLRSPKALLYDPALLRTLQNLMKKLFLQLVAQFKKVNNITIVYANFNRMVICTGRQTITDASVKVKTIIHSIKAKDLFHSLTIEEQENCWEQLVWWDVANFAGIQGKLPQFGNNEAQQDDDDAFAVAMNWNLIEGLPDICKRSFELVIAGYINTIYAEIRKIQTNTTLPSEANQNIGLESYGQVVEFAKELLLGEISQNLFLVTERIDSRVKDRNMTLEFIKATCHVLGLEPALKETVDQLKSNLLRLINVGEFSEKAVWTNRSVSYVIPQVICKACNHCRDIDLGRDQHRSETGWLCPHCNSLYDNAEITNILLDIISRKFLAYNLQDLQCKKCGQIKRENLIVHCQCAGEFRCLISKTELVKLLETFLSLAETYEMLALSETVKQTLELVY